MSRKLFAFFAAAALLLGMSACENEDNPSSSGQEEAVVTPAQLKQGIWTEYDTVLVAAGKATMEELAEMPAVGMMIDGDKAYFFEYTADDVSEPVEGKISYDSNTGKGSITFPTIKDNALSGQSVSFNATTDETMEFELSYEGQKMTAAFSWLCDDIDNWGEEVTNEEWEELMGYYNLIDAEWGPDPTIDWGDLDEPLTWDETPKANTRVATAVLEGISTGLDIFSSLFEPDPVEEINAKLDALLEKVDQVLQNQQAMMAKLDKIDQRLIAIAQKLNQQETVGIFNNRNEKFYSKFVPQNTAFFDDAYAKYKANKNDPELKDYAEAWAGKDEKFIGLTWEYAEYITSVTHSKYGSGMDKIYDGITYEKYPWEHIGIDDRKNYRAYDLTMLAKCIFMISLYAQHCQTNKIIKKGYYKNYENYREKLKAYSTFNVANPDEFLVCQIPGAHFVMRKELQKYNYYGKDRKSPMSGLGPHTLVSWDAAYRPEWHEAGTPKIDNPKEVKAKLIRTTEMKSIHQYYQALYNQQRIWWMKIFVDGAEMPAGAVYSKAPSGVKDNKLCLLLYNQERPHQTGFIEQSFFPLRLEPVMEDYEGGSWTYVGSTDHSGRKDWSSYYFNQEYYAAIVEKRY